MSLSHIEHGYVKFIDRWGSDQAIIEAARMSTNKGFIGWDPVIYQRCAICNEVITHVNQVCRVNPDEGHMTETINHPGDQKLLTYLYENKHMTPFEMAGMTIEVQAPIFVFREWHRHRTQSYNEMSARYTELPNLYYIPNLARAMATKQSTKNKQASMIEAQFNIEEGQAIRLKIDEAIQHARKIYELLLEAGVAREVARVVLPVAQYSRMRASANLRNWLSFLTLRQAENAQWEIRQYANEVARLIGEHFPRTYALFTGGGKPS